MKLRKNKKGFTIVELVIVIGVIGILSAILIPTFVNLTDNANKAAAKQEVADAYTLYLVEANDQIVDGYYGRKGTSDEYKEVKIDYLTNDKVALKRGNEFFVYGKEGWEVTANTYNNLVASYPTGFGEDQKVYTKNNTVYSVATDVSLNTLSTFNKVTVYIK